LPVEVPGNGSAAKLGRLSFHFLGLSIFTHEVIMARGVICQKCGVEAPSKYVEFYYNIGMLVMRRHRAVKGNLCKRCIHKTFWQFTLIDVTLGPWGMISLVVAPIFLVNNIVRYVSAIPLSATPSDAAPPRLTQEEAAKITKYRKELVDRLNQKEPLADVAESIARSAGVTPGQVVLYIRALSQPRPSQQPTGGFPVVPLPKPAPAPASIPLEQSPAAPQPTTAPPPAPPSRSASSDLIADIGLE
jgi:hypothetical protein